MKRKSVCFPRAHFILSVNIIIIMLINLCILVNNYVYQKYAIRMYIIYRIENIVPITKRKCHSLIFIFQFVHCGINNIIILNLKLCRIISNSYNYNYTIAIHMRGGNRAFVADLKVFRIFRLSLYIYQPI